MTYKEIISNLRMAQSFHCQNYNICNAIEEAIALVISKRDGLIIELPCKVGDTLYRIDIDTKFVEPISHILKKSLYLDCFLVFLTKEEAEAKLKELKENDN